MAARRTFRGREERALTKKLLAQIGKCTRYEERLEKRRLVMAQAVKWLQQGRPAQVVLALIQEQIPDAVRVIDKGSADEEWLRRQIEGLGEGG